MKRFLCLCAIVLACAGGVSAQTLEQDFRRVEDLIILAQHPKNGPETLDQLIEARQRLIGLHPSDERVATWLIDQATDEMRRLSIYATDSTVLLGIPSDAQRAQTKRVSQAVVALVARARKQAETRIAQYDQLSELTAAQETTLDQLKDLDLPIRIPYLESRALLLQVASDVKFGQAANISAKSVQSALGTLNTFTIPPSGAEVSRRTNIALAQLMIGSADSITAAADTIAGIDEMSKMTRNPSALRPDLATSVELALARAIVAEMNIDPLSQSKEPEQPGVFDSMMTERPFSLGDETTQVYRVLAYDARTRFLMARAAAAAGNAPLYNAIVARACATQISLVHDDLSLDPDQLRSLVLQRLRTMTKRVTHTPTLPPLAELCAIADRATTNKDPLACAEMMQSLADRPDAGDVRAQALWEAAVLYMQADPVPDTLPDISVELLHALASEFPHNELTPRAIGAILPALRNQSIAQPHSPHDQDRYSGMLELAVRTRGVPEIDYWRYELARTLLDRRPQWDTTDLTRALELLVQIDPTSRVAEQSQMLYIATISDTLGQLDASDPHDAGAIAAQATVVLEQIRAWNGIEETHAVQLRQLRAQAWLTLHDPRAVTELESLTTTNEAAIRALPGNGWETRVLLARALVDHNEPERAFKVALSIATALDADPRDPSKAQRPIYFWQAWEIMLGVLARRVEADPTTRDQTLGTMRTQLLRLRQIDPSLGSGFGVGLEKIVENAQTKPH